MKGGQSGFTIVETLIVLAITMALFTAVTLTIAGRQRTTAFSQATRSLQSQMEQVVNEVGSGQYQNDGKIVCTNASGTMKLTNGAGVQGRNQDCVFIGKVVRFGVGTADPQPYHVYTIAGLRSSSDDATASLSSAKARLVAIGSGDPANFPDAYDKRIQQYGLTVATGYAGGVTAIGLTSNLTSLGGGDNSQTVNTLAIKNVVAGATKEVGVKQIDDNLYAAGLAANPADGARVCFNSGTSRQSALLTIGGGNRQGSVDMQIFSKPSCTNA